MLKLKAAFILTILVILLAACAPAASNSVPVTSVTITNSPATAQTSPTSDPAATSTTTMISGAPTTTATSSANAVTTAATSTAPDPSSGSSNGAMTTYTVVAAKSEASYSVREQLARLNFPTDAVGKTNAITGSVAIKPDGSIDTASSKFTVDLSTLQTDSNMRDNFVRRNILQTAQYPQAVFVPTQVSGLPASLPQNGNVSFKLTGNMTIHGVTKPVTWDVTGAVNNGEANGKATTSFTFEDFGLQQPQVPVVLSVVDKITLNLTIDLQKSGG